MGVVTAIRNGAKAAAAGTSIAVAGNGDTVRSATKDIEIGDGNTLFFELVGGQSSVKRCDAVDIDYSACANAFSMSVTSDLLSGSVKLV